MHPPILLDVDNGPDGLTRRVNDHLYGHHRLCATMTALKPGGILAVWSAEPDAAFTERLQDAGFAVQELTVREMPNDQGANHVIWFAQKPRIVLAGVA